MHPILTFSLFCEETEERKKPHNKKKKTKHIIQHEKEAEIIK